MNGHRKSLAKKQVAQEQVTRELWAEEVRDTILRRERTSAILTLLRQRFANEDTVPIEASMMGLDATTLASLFNEAVCQGSWKLFCDKSRHIVSAAQVVGAYSREPSEFDQAWKSIFLVLAYDFLALVAPELFKRINTSRKPQDLSHELDALLPQSRASDREADILLKMWLKDGSEYYFLLHAEVQLHDHASFGMRMFEMWYRTRDKHRKPIFPIAITSFGDVDETRAVFRENFEGKGVEYIYSVFNLRRFLDPQKLAELKAQNNIFATIIEAHLKASEPNAIEPSSKAQWFQKVLAEVRSAGLSDEKKEAVVRFLKWVVPLDDYEEKELSQELEKRGVISMFVLPSERRAEAKGEAKGKAQVVLKTLRRFFPMPDASIEEFMRRLVPLGAPTIDILVDSMDDFHSEGDLRLWIAKQEEAKRAAEACIESKASA